MVKTFQEFMQPKRKYSAIIYDDATQENLTKFCLDHGLDISKNFEGYAVNSFEFHTTIFMGKHPRFLKNEEIYWKGTTTMKEYTLFGEEKNIPVAILNSQDIRNVRKYFGELLGEEDLTYPDFVPHITLSYHYDGDLGELPLIDFPLTFKKVVIRDAKEI